MESGDNSEMFLCESSLSVPGETEGNELRPPSADNGISDDSELGYGISCETVLSIAEDSEGTSGIRPSSPQHENSDKRKRQTCRDKRKRQACLICSKTFSRKRDLEVHVRTHSGEKPYTCRVCGKRFAQVFNMKCHVRTHEKYRKTLKCSFCPRVFLSRPGLVQHQWIHSGQGLLPCPECGKRFPGRTRLERHLLVHNTSKKFSCHVCKRGFNEKYQLSKHVCVSGNGEKRKRNRNNTKRNDKGNCTQAESKSKDEHEDKGILFNLLQSYKKNTKLDERSANASCTENQEVQVLEHENSQTFGTLLRGTSELALPAAEETQTSRPRPKALSLLDLGPCDGEMQHECPICHRRFRFEVYLERHFRKHPNERPLVCDVCGKGFRSVFNFKRHQGTHDAVRKRHKCTFCPRTFLTREGFVQHERTHTGQGLLPCPMCDRKSTCRMSLKKHLLTHRRKASGGDESETLILGASSRDSDTETSIKLLVQGSQEVRENRGRHKCRLCKEIFKFKKEFQEHIRTTHPDACRVCGKVFLDADGLKSHEETHVTNRKKFECGFCSKTFLSRMGLDCHQKSHTGQGILSCPKCGQKCMDSFRLRRHLRTHDTSKKFSCYTCKKGFTERNKLLKHVCSRKRGKRHGDDREKTLQDEGIAVMPEPGNKGGEVPYGYQGEPLLSSDALAKIVKVEDPHVWDEGKESHLQDINTPALEVENPEDWILPDKPPVLDDFPFLKEHAVLENTFPT